MFLIGKSVGKKAAGGVSNRLSTLRPVHASASPYQAPLAFLWIFHQRLSFASSRCQRWRNEFSNFRYNFNRNSHLITATTGCLKLYRDVTHRRTVNWFSESCWYTPLLRGSEIIQLYRELRLFCRKINLHLRRCTTRANTRRWKLLLQYVELW